MNEQKLNNLIHKAFLESKTKEIMDKIDEVSKTEDFVNFVKRHNLRYIYKHGFWCTREDGSEFPASNEIMGELKKYKILFNVSWQILGILVSSVF